MTRKDTDLIAAALASVEAITETTDVDGIGSSTLRLAVNQISAAIKAQYPRFHTGHFEVAALPLQSERRKQMILKAVAVDEERRAARR